jgi:hypothetical protein
MLQGFACKGGKVGVLFPSRKRYFTKAVSRLFCSIVNNNVDGQAIFPIVTWAKEGLGLSVGRSFFPLSIYYYVLLLLLLLLLLLPELAQSGHLVLLCAAS